MHPQVYMMYISVQWGSKKNSQNMQNEEGPEKNHKESSSQLCANSDARNHEALCIELHKGMGFIKNILRNAGLKHQVCFLMEMTC